jgi:hypothetical protein
MAQIWLCEVIAPPIKLVPPELEPVLTTYSIVFDTSLSLPSPLQEH